MIKSQSKAECFGHWFGLEEVGKSLIIKVTTITSINRKLSDFEGDFGRQRPYIWPKII